MKKKVVLIVVIIFVGCLIFGITRMMKNPDKYQNQGGTEYPVVLDCSKFSRISANELKTELGEPLSVDEYINPTQKGDFTMQDYKYQFDGFTGEFLIYEDSVVRVMLFADPAWKIENFDTRLFGMFGIEPTDKLKQTVGTGVVYKYTPVSDNVAEVDFMNCNKEDKTFDTLYVTYNLNYFD